MFSLSKPLYVSAQAGQRNIADLLEAHVANYYVDQGGTLPETVRTIEDVSIGDRLIDIKTRDINREFSMPNLISVDRLRKSKDKNIQYHFIDYKVVDGATGFTGKLVEITGQSIIDVWDIDWTVLKIQNLGKGQLQLCGVKDYNIIPRWVKGKDKWFERLETEMKAFYTKQIEKFEGYIKDLK
tara:strand:- start:10 stop:558 length:549 start_codon:yes stop_codon:yes gene_type:complete